VLVAALYDVHGNLPALDAVLADVERENVDAVVAGGDILWGPYQAECIERLREVGARFVAGNCERDVLAAITDTGRWCLDQLAESERSFVASWPQTVELDLDGLGHALFCHATPADVDAIITQLTPEDALRAALAGVAADVVVCGHTHVQFDRRPVDAPRLVNAGSVGLAYERVAGAYWALLGADVELRRTSYDTTSAAERLAATGFPQVDRVFGAALRGEVSPEEATARFESRRGA
jgi:predicted phosphodiesterase